MTAPAVTAAGLLLAEVRAGGGGDLVLSPGSRSAPVALAAAAAERAGWLRLHVRLDERSAAFTALGIAKVTGVPVPVLCTSGTAAANLAPAVAEARYGGVPLVVITADRPPELRGRGASQTIDQVGMFDHHVLGSRDLPVPGDPGWERPWLDQVRGSFALAARLRGPVHLNLPLRPPLVDPGYAAAIQALPGPAAALDQGPAARTPVIPDTAAGSEPGDAAAIPVVPGAAAAGASADLSDLPARTVVVAGDLDVWDDPTRAAIAGFAQRAGWPIVWEASSGLAAAPTAITHGTLLLADPAARHALRPDAVVTVGPFGLDRGVLALVRSAGRHVSVRMRPRTDHPDPLGTATSRVNGPPTGTPPAADPSWLAAWRAASARLAATLAAEPGPMPPGAEPGRVEAATTVGSVAAAVWSALDGADLLVVAPSLTIRQVAALGVGAGPHVLANRGANGIDGLLATAWGAASAWPGRTVALMGDLAFLHDHNGLLVPDREPRPNLTVVVADNNGGGIFTTLEQGAGDYARDFDRVFATPHDRDLVAIAAALRLPAERIAAADLPRRLAEPAVGVRVLIVPVAPVSPTAPSASRPV